MHTVYTKSHTVSRWTVLNVSEINYDPQGNINTNEYEKIIIVYSLYTCVIIYYNV